MPPLAFSSMTYHIEGGAGDMSPASPLWHYPLSGRAAEFENRLPRPCPPEKTITIGDYFEAAGIFVSRIAMDPAVKPISGIPGTPLEWDLSLCLEKHGTFYHPIRVVVAHRHGTTSLVLNGAVSRQGLALVAKEANLLARVAGQVPFQSTPNVFAQGCVETPKGPVGFWLGQWFEPFYEFHATEQNGERQVVIWAPHGQGLFLSFQAAGPLYENVARTLTWAYDLETGAQIFPWHHAAGDFIVNPKGDGLPVRLITVRGYGPLIDTDVNKTGPLPGLLFFFLNLSLRMQLDRLDGKGEAIFLGREVFYAGVRGMLRALREKAGKCRRDPARAFAEFARQFSGDQIMAVLIHLMDVWPPGPSENGLIRANLGALCQEICHCFKSGKSQDFY